MITKATEEMTKEIRELWRICFPKEDPNYTEYYFRNIFDPSNCYVYVMDGKVVSCLIRNPHVMMFNNRALKTSMISDVATLPEYRNKGYEQKLLDIVMDACEHTELVTLARTETPQLYARYGFKPVYRRSQYTIARADCQRTTNFGCTYDPVALDLLKVYSAFISRFNGFYARDLDYFNDYIKEVRAGNGKIVAYFNGKDQIRGYASMIPEGNVMVVRELIYLDGQALQKLCNAALQEKKSVRLIVSEAENLSRVFPNAERKDFNDTMMKLNDARLFTKLYNKPIEIVDEVEKFSDKPLNLNEFA